MSILYIILGFILLIFIVWLARKIPKKKKTESPKEHLILNNEIGQPQSITVKKSNLNHPNIIILYVSDDNSELSRTWNKIAKNFDPATYDLRTISNTKDFDYWKIKTTPCIRTYDSHYRYHPDHYDEYIGDFDVDSIKKYISSK